MVRKAEKKVLKNHNRGVYIVETRKHNFKAWLSLHKTAVRVLAIVGTYDNGAPDVVWLISMSSSPLSEAAAEPIGLERFYDAEPEKWTDEDLKAAIAAQRAEREKRLKIRKTRKLDVTKIAPMELLCGDPLPPPPPYEDKGQP